MVVDLNQAQRSLILGYSYLNEHNIARRAKCFTDQLNSLWIVMYEPDVQVKYFLPYL